MCAQSSGTAYVGGVKAPPGVGVAHVISIVEAINFWFLVAMFAIMMIFVGLGILGTQKREEPEELELY